MSEPNQARESAQPRPGAQTAFRRFSRPLMTTGIIINTAVFLIAMFGDMLFYHAWSTKAVFIGLGVLVVVMALMGVVVPLIAKRASARFYAILERDTGAGISLDDLKVIRHTLLLIPWRAACVSALGWLIVVPSLTYLAFHLFGENLSFLETETIALAITPFTFAATLLGQDQILSPFVRFYFPAAGAEGYGSKFTLTSVKKALLFVGAFVLYPLIFMIVLGVNAINSSKTVAEASHRFSELAWFGVAFLAVFLGSFLVWRFRKFPARQLTQEMDFDKTSSVNGEPEAVIDVQENMVGTTLDGKYLLEDVLGKGGMATVYRGKHLVMNSPVAVKILDRSFSQDKESIRRFQQESRALVTVRHNNIVQVYDCGSTETGVLYLVMDYIEGAPLDGLIETDLLSADNALKIMRQVCEAIAHAHEKRVVHRDLKPSNVMIVTGDGGEMTAKVVDFGIAKVIQEQSEATRLTRTGEVFGSPAYMSPEQCQGLALDHRSDIYSLGCVFYELFTGSTPFECDNFLRMACKHINDMPPPMKYRDRFVGRGELQDRKEFLTEAQRTAIEKLVAKCLQKDPQLRYQTMGELLQDLPACQSALPI